MSRRDCENERNLDCQVDRSHFFKFSRIQTKNIKKVLRDHSQDTSKDTINLIVKIIKAVKVNKRKLLTYQYKSSIYKIVYCISEEYY